MKSDYCFMLKYSKIKVCHCTIPLFLIKIYIIFWNKGWHRLLGLENWDDKSKFRYPLIWILVSVWFTFDNYAHLIKFSKLKIHYKDKGDFKILLMIMSNLEFSLCALIFWATKIDSKHYLDLVMTETQPKKTRFWTN